MVPLREKKKWVSDDRYFTFKYRSGSRYSDAKYNVVRDLACESTSRTRMDANDKVTEQFRIRI